VPVVDAEQHALYEKPHTGVPPQAGQYWAASFAQMLSQCVVQQNGSKPHTRVQQLPSEQNLEPGFAAVQQLFGALPHAVPVMQSAHMVAASFAQIESHRVLQQKGSTAQTDWQQAESVQAGVFVVEAVQQSLTACPQLGVPPQVGQYWVASVPQMESQLTLQQYGSKPHTSVQQRLSEQYGTLVGDATQQLFGLLPQDAHTAHIVSASFAQMLSQYELQQKGSTAHTVWQHGAFEHPAVMSGLAEQQALVEVPHTAWPKAPAHVSSRTHRHAARLTLKVSMGVPLKLGNQRPTASR
jgi:hypothetical protein